DIDRERCTPELEAAMQEDLHWLGLDWETPVRRQSEHFGVYRDVLDRLIRMDLVYPAFLSRGDIKREMQKATAKGLVWPHDPDGAALYP
ncbi:glutamate--tRNA ligase family protein, partial [Stenotrophomonas maltophilia]|uniref:glutamate--tRNA ligase family protein n=3 Tax=Pseudomonadota TaxID=1224 RepID=UPI001EF9175C